MLESESEKHLPKIPCHRPLLSSYQLLRFDPPRCKMLGALTRQTIRSSHSLLPYPVDPYRAYADVIFCQLSIRLIMQQDARVPLL